MREPSTKHNELDVSFWNHRWRNGMTGWDIGYPSPPITQYMDQYQNKDAAILIPGCGNAYEAEYLVANRFTNITLVDIADEAVKRLKIKFRNKPEIKILCEDFFAHQGNYDLVIEQTFFCAQVLERRTEYVKKMASLLREGGRLIGVLFNLDFGKAGPPFGGNHAEYQKLFAPCFTIKTMEECYNSIRPRAGTELFINLEKK